MKLIILSALFGVSLGALAQQDVITKVPKFKPPVVASFLGSTTDSAAISVTDASRLIGLPLTATDAGKNVYPIDSYHFLYKKKGAIHDEETGKQSIAFTTLADFFTATPLPNVWIDNLKDTFQPGEELLFFDILVKDPKGRKFFAHDLKIFIHQ